MTGRKDMKILVKHSFWLFVSFVDALLCKENKLVKHNGVLKFQGFFLVFMTEYFSILPLGALHGVVFNTDSGLLGQKSAQLMTTLGGYLPPYYGTSAPSSPNPLSTLHQSPPP